MHDLAKPKLMEKSRHAVENNRYYNLGLFTFYVIIVLLLNNVGMYVMSNLLI